MPGQEDLGVRVGVGVEPEASFHLPVMVAGLTERVWRETKFGGC